MTLNGAIMQLVELSEHPMMPVIFRPLIQKVIETISELEENPEPHWIPVTEEPMNDLISRQQAIDISKDLTITVEGYEMHNQAVMNYCADIMQLPPIQPKRGKWIYCEDSMADCVDGYRCDQCGFFVPWDYQHKGIDFIQDYNFCPNCGAKMEEKT